MIINGKKVKNIITRDNIKEKLYNIDLTDKEIYKEVNNPFSYNLFQMGGKAYKELSGKVKPKNWEEINACNAMARPGTIDFLDDYIRGKQGITKYQKKIHEVLIDTYGNCIYQEQIMSIFNKIGGFSLEETDKVRSIMKKLSKKDKKQEDLDKWNAIIDKFSIKAKELGITEKEIKIITDDLVNLSSYSFNRSHCYTYSYLGMITAYLSTYYKTQFYCASLNHEDKVNDILTGLNACKSNNIKILPPDINESETCFSTKRDKEIYFGLKGIKNVGEKSLNVIMQNRPYKNFKEFITNPKNKDRAITSRVINALISVGCFDKTDGKENRKFLKQFYKIFTEKTKNKKKNINEIYDESFLLTKEIPEIQTTETDIELWENEYLGYSFFTNKFTEEIYNSLNKFNIKYYNYITELTVQPKPFLMQIKDVRIHFDKNNHEMAFIKLSDSNNNITSIPIFASSWKLIKDQFIENDIILIILRKQNDNKVFYGKTNFMIDEDIKKCIVNISIKMMK